MLNDYKLFNPVDNNVNQINLVTNDINNRYYRSNNNNTFLSHNQLIQRVKNYKEKFEKARLDSFTKSKKILRIHKL